MLKERILLISTILIVIVLSYQNTQASSNNSEMNELSISNSESGRTFGRIKRFQMLLIPLAYKMGLFTAVIGIILLLTLKSVLIGKAILFLNVAFMLVKLGAFFFKHKLGASDWDHNKKNIHIHLHGANQGYHGYQGWVSPEIPGWKPEYPTSA
uniref:CSON004179 protein n=1 Tax=Culicoides sonorensis TaxID=179676 RepID=A0A336LWS4_CULSO